MDGFTWFYVGCWVGAAIILAVSLWNLRDDEEKRDS